MARYIDADALMVEVQKGTIISDDLYGIGIMAGVDSFAKKLEAAPTITLDDLRPKSHWNVVEFDEASRRITIECSECGMVEELTVMAYGFGHNFCPNCGADMRGGGEDG